MLAQRRFGRNRLSLGKRSDYIAQDHRDVVLIRPIAGNLRISFACGIKLVFSNIGNAGRVTEEESLNSHYINGIDCGIAVHVSRN